MLSYRHGPEAMDWLAAAFGFRESTRWLDDDGVLAHGEMATDKGVIMLATPTLDYEGPLRHRSHCDGAAAWSAAPWVVDGVSGLRRRRRITLRARESGRSPAAVRPRGGARGQSALPRGG